MTYNPLTAVPVPAIPPRGPQVTLVGSSITPGGEGDDVHFVWPDGERLDVIPEDLQFEVNLRDDEKWTRLGFGYLPEAHTALIPRATDDITTVDAPGTPPNLSKVLYVPIWHFAKFTASTFGWETLDYAGRAERQLDLGLPASIEKEFWTGTIAQAAGLPNNYLESITAHGTDGNLTPGATNNHDGTAVSISKGLAILQDAIRQNGFGGQGMIHCQPGTAPNLLSTRRQGKLLLDQFDNFIVPGAGYPGTGPGGNVPTAGTSWMYATDMVLTRMQKAKRTFPSSMQEAVDRGQFSAPNEVTFRSGKMAAAYFDASLLVCVLVNLPS